MDMSTPALTASCCRPGGLLAPHADAGAAQASCWGTQENWYNANAMRLPNVQERGYKITPASSSAAGLYDSCSLVPKTFSSFELFPGKLATGDYENLLRQLFVLHAGHQPDSHGPCRWRILCSVVERKISKSRGSFSAAQTELATSTTGIWHLRCVPDPSWGP